MKACLFAAIAALLVLVPVRSFGDGIDARQVLSEQLGLSPADAAAYWDGLSYTAVSLVAQGKRVALDGLGAFEPAYRNGDSGKVVHTMKFSFDLGPATEQPCVESVFDDGFIKALTSFAWLQGTGGRVERRLEGDEWQKLVDVFVFCILRNIDGHARQPLGMGLGDFFPTVDVDLSTERDDNQRRLVVDFVADDDSPEKFAYQLELSVSTLEKMIAILDRETANLHRYARLTGIRDYTTAAQQVGAVSADWTAELTDLSSGTKAQDHNSSRSNKTASIISGGVDELGGAQETLKKAAAQDHNSSRSNKTASAISNVEEGGGWASETLTQRAQDHNSSRSNKTASKSADFYNDLLNRYDGAYTTRAQDHNSSRSNKTASVIADFDPSPELESLLARIATF